jgi:hypothetical protein
MAYIAPKVLNGIYQNSGWVPNVNTRAYWKLNGDFLDYSGNNFHLNSFDIGHGYPTTNPHFDYYGPSTVPSFTPGKFGSGVKFLGDDSGNLLWYNGSAQILTSGNKNSFTYSAWANPFSDTDGYFINAGCYQASAGGGNGYWSGLASGGNFSTSAADGSIGTYTVDQWNHYCYVSDVSGMTVYCNGVAGSQITNTPLDLLDNYFYLGCGMSYQGIYWNSCHISLCEVIVENVAWQASDVTNYYNKYK